MKHILKYWSKEKDFEYQLVAQSLMKSLMREMAQAIVQYDSDKYNYFDAPYRTNERGMDAVFLPALAKICKGLVMTEVYTVRKPNRTKVDEDPDEHIGRIDYWCIYRDYTFLIELKHSKESVSCKKLTTETIERWNTMLDQLKYIRRDAKQREEHTKQVIPLGIHLVTLRAAANRKDSLVDEKELQKTWFDMVRQTLNSNFQAMWLLPNKLVKDELEMDGLTKVTQALAMMAYIAERAINHKGSKDYNI